MFRLTESAKKAIKKSRANKKRRERYRVLRAQKRSALRDRRVTDITDPINHPPHYGGDTPYEVIKVIHAWELNHNFNLGNAIKYIARAGKKDPNTYLEDLEKAMFYLAYEVKETDPWRGRAGISQVPEHPGD